MSVDPLAALARVDLLANAAPEALSQLVGLRGPVVYAAEEEIITQGAGDARLHVVLEGEARVSVNGVERAYLYEGDYFGEISLIDPAPRASSVAAGPQGLTALELTPADLEPLMEDNEFLRGVNKALCARLRDLELNDITWSMMGPRPPAHGHDYRLQG